MIQYVKDLNRKKSLINYNDFMTPSIEHEKLLSHPSLPNTTCIPATFQKAQLKRLREHEDNLLKNHN